MKSVQVRNMVLNADDIKVCNALMGSTKAVSYTHLDVYKRQSLLSRRMALLHRSVFSINTTMLL